MRLTKRAEKNAQAELINLVKENPRARTSQLVGTPLFHGVRTLSRHQVVRLLRQGGATPYLCGAGARTWFEWEV